jgi:hypothetical protein
MATAFNVGTANANSLTKPLTARVPEQYSVVLDVVGVDSSIQQQFPMYGVIPERYSIGVSSDYDTPLAAPSAGNLAQSMVNKKFGTTGALSALSPIQQYLAKNAGSITDSAFKALGGTNKLKYQMLQVWQATSPMSVNVEIVLNAYSDANIDVKQKLKALMKLVVPSEGSGGMMNPPGPNVLNIALGRRITLRMGTFMVIEDAIIRNVNADIQTLCGADGIPMAITTTATIETPYAAVTDLDIDRMFPG